MGNNDHSLWIGILSANNGYTAYRNYSRVLNYVRAVGKYSITNIVAATSRIWKVSLSLGERELVSDSWLGRRY